MLHGLQNFVGTSIAAFGDVAETTIVQSVSAGPSASGSAFGGSGGKGWRLRGSI